MRLHGLGIALLFATPAAARSWTAAPSGTITVGHPPLTKLEDRTSRRAVRASIAGGRHVVVLEGINDLVRSVQRQPRSVVGPDTLIVGFSQPILRGHAAGLKMWRATVMPYRVEILGADGEQTRQAVNAWIRADREADGAIDFDKAVRDPADRSRIAVAYDSGDHLHPNDDGMAAMAAAIDLERVRRR